MRNTLLILILATWRLALIADSGTPERTPPNGTLTLLFAGSSSTYFNDMPAEVAKVVDRRIIDRASMTVRPEIVGRSGSDIRTYLEPGFKKYEYGVKKGQTFMEKIRDERPDLVVLQTVARFIMGDEDPTGTGLAHAQAVTTYCEAVRKAGGEPIFYEMGWGKDAREAEGRKRILELAAQNKVRFFVPCSTAWARAYQERPDLSLQHPQDGAHPGDIGHFLNLACFYAALVGESPVGKLPRTFKVWPHGKYELEEAKITAFRPTPYQAKMPKWMHRSMASNLTATIDDDTARYLENVAWESTLRIKKLLISKQEEIRPKTSAREEKPGHAVMASGGTDQPFQVARFLEAYCLDCHDKSSKKGDLDLSEFTDESAVMKNRDVWRSVFEKIESHQMPPPKQKTQPSAAERTELMSWVMDLAGRPVAALEARDPGKPTLRRLTRLEYNNAIRDLFGLPMDVFIFPERLPLRDKGYFKPESGRMQDGLQLEMREYGSRYPVLCPQLGLPSDNRAEHGYSNRGDAMNFSPLTLEKHVAAALEIVNAPELPARSRIFADLIGVKQPRSPSATDDHAPLPTVPLVGRFAPDVARIQEATGRSIPLADFRLKTATAFAEGRGGVFEIPQTLANKVVAGKGGLIKGAYGKRLITINPDADLWCATFSSVKATSAPAILTNKNKGRKRFALTFDIQGEDPDEVIEHLGLCMVGRRGQSGLVKLTAVLTDGSETTIDLDMAEGETGTTFCSFSAHAGDGIRKLVVDATRLSGDYAVLDDIAVTTNGLKQTPEPSTATSMGHENPGQAQPPSADRPSSPAQTVAQRLHSFAERAYRRPVSPEELSGLMAAYDSARKDNASEADAARLAVATILASPSFLYVEANGTTEAGKVSPLEDNELATRLALFLWSSTPDEELLKLARAGRLHEPATLEAQTLRMLKDRRCRELSESFAVQWLRLDQLYTAKPDRDLFRNFYSGPQGKSTLHGAALTEALLLFETVLVEDRAITDFIAADYTWLNPQLAKLYDLQIETGKDQPAEAATSNRELRTKNDKAGNWRRVKLPDARRGGFMTMAAPMIVTSLPFRTSPVKRGAWLLETIFNRPPTEPKVAFAIENDTKEAAQRMSSRQKFEAHRNKPACFSCHVRLDPPGFALERFNAVGQWRELDAGTPVDAKGEWNGQPFDGPVEFKAILAKEPHEFTRGFIEHLLSFSLARPLTIHDMPVVEQIQKAAKADRWKFSRVVVEITKSYPFTHTRNAP